MFSNTLLQICSQLSERLEKQQASFKNELERIKVILSLTFLYTEEIAVYMLVLNRGIMGGIMHIYLSASLFLPLSLYVPFLTLPMPDLSLPVPSLSLSPFPSLPNRHPFQ